MFFVVVLRDKIRCRLSETAETIDFIDQIQQANDYLRSTNK